MLLGVREVFGNQIAVEVTGVGTAGRRFAQFELMLLRLVIITSAAYAQPGETGQGEFAIYTGFTAGGVGTHPAVGASTGLFLSRYVVGLFDVSYSPLSS